MQQTAAQFLMFQIIHSQIYSIINIFIIKQSDYDRAGLTQKYSTTRVPLFPTLTTTHTPDRPVETKVNTALLLRHQLNTH